jgi:hypothetical protein
MYAHDEEDKGEHENMNSYSYHSIYFRGARKEEEELASCWQLLYFILFYFQKVS